MVDVGPDAGSGLAGRFVSGTSVRVRRLAVVSAAAVVAALVVAWNAAVDAALELVGWLATAPSRWWWGSAFRQIVADAPDRLVPPALAAAIGSVQGLGPLALPAAAVAAFGAVYGGFLGWEVFFR